MTIEVRTDLTFREAVRKHSGEDVHTCLYCQRCAIGCPTVYLYVDHKTVVVRKD